MKTQEAVEHFGGPKGLAKVLDIWPHAISRWGDHPPELRQYQIEKLTGGLLKAETKNKKG